MSKDVRGGVFTYVAEGRRIASVLKETDNPLTGFNSERFVRECYWMLVVEVLDFQVIKSRAMTISWDMTNVKKPLNSVRLGFPTAARVEGGMATSPLQSTCKASVMLFENSPHNGVTYMP